MWESGSSGERSYIAYILFASLIELRGVQLVSRKMASETAASGAVSASTAAELPTWVDFSLGEDVRNDRRLEQDQRWAKAISDGRVHLSHREFVLLYAPRFQAAIQDFYVVHLLVRGLYSAKSTFRCLNELLLTFIIEYAFPGQAPLVPAIIEQCKTEHRFASPFCQALQAQRQDFMVCLRKRPLLWQEKEMGIYDVTSIPSSSQWMQSYHQHIHSAHSHPQVSLNEADTKSELNKNQYPQSMLLHEGKLARNGRLLSMTHHHVLFDRVYGESTSTVDICEDVVSPLIDRCFQGKSSTLLCFGQTGTGKTYTFEGTLQYLAGRLVGKRLYVTFYEVHGKKCYDLFQNRQEISLKFDGKDQLHACGAHGFMLPAASDMNDFLFIIETAMRLRMHEVTERNPISSRSHAVCTIQVFNPIVRHCTVGKLTMVDLAGSERNYETQKMTGRMHKESAEINMALMSLKNCFRAYHRHEQRIPYRESTLTKVLKPCFFSSSMSTRRNESSQSTYINPTARVHKAQSLAAYLQPNTPNSKPQNEATGSLDQSVKPPNPPDVPSDSHFAKSLDDLLKTLPEAKQINPIDDDRHFTVIIGTLSPSPIDIQHSLNTIKHILLMTRVPMYLDPTYDCATNLIPLTQSSAVTVEVPKTSLAALTSVPMHQWTEEQVISWLATVERGKFAHLILPRGTTGKDLLQLSIYNIAQLFEQSERFGRREDAGEGPVWVITADLDQITPIATAPTETNDQFPENNASIKWRAFSVALYTAVRREINAFNRQQAILNEWSLKSI